MIGMEFDASAVDGPYRVRVERRGDGVLEPDVWLCRVIASKSECTSVGELQEWGDEELMEATS